MFARDVEMFIEHCENKGLATKTIGSYEQTLRLLMLWLDEQGITQTEKITHDIQAKWSDKEQKVKVHLELDAEMPKADLMDILKKAGIC